MDLRKFVADCADRVVAYEPLIEAAPTKAEKKRLRARRRLLLELMEWGVTRQGY